MHVRLVGLQQAGYECMCASCYTSSAWWLFCERTGAEEAYLSPKWGSGDLQVNGYLDLNPSSPGGQDDTSDVMPWGSGGGVPGVRPFIC